MQQNQQRKQDSRPELSPPPHVRRRPVANPGKVAPPTNNNTEIRRSTKNMTNHEKTMFGVSMSQEWQDINIWERFFQTFTIKTFIELGSGRGGSSLFFGLQCAQRGIEFHTFDNQINFDPDDGLMAAVNIRKAFHNIDIFVDKGIVIDLIKNSPKPLAIFFDDGNKPLEWKTFGPHTQPGDFCIVHDWGTEFKPEDVGDLPVTRIMEKLADGRGIGWKCMWFVRK